MEKTFGQKIAMAIAVLCYIAGVGCAVGGKTAASLMRRIVTRRGAAPRWTGGRDDRMEVRS